MTYAHPDLQIRQATHEEAPELARLRYAFRTELEPATESYDGFLARCEAWILERLIPAGSWQCWAAEHGGSLVGTAWLQLIEKLPNPVSEPEWHGYITSVYVVPEQRGQGIGAALLGECLRECKRLGVDAVFLWPTARSRALYSREGFGPAEDLFELRLGAKHQDGPS